MPEQGYGPRQPGSGAWAPEHRRPYEPCIPLSSHLALPGWLTVFSVLPTGQATWLLHTTMLLSPPSLPGLHNSPGGLSQVLYFIDLNQRYPSRLVTLSPTKLSVCPSLTLSSPVGVNIICTQTGQGNRSLFLACLTLLTPLNSRRIQSNRILLLRSLVIGSKSSDNPRKFFLTCNIRMHAIYLISFFPLKQI